MAKKIVGFAGYDCTYKDFFAPTGDAPEYRDREIGRALIKHCLEAMRDKR